MRAFNEELIAEFRANGGAVGGRLAGQPLILLTTTGARSGQPRTTPLGYLRDGERLALFASNLGAPEPPAWYRNVVAHPEVTIEVGDERFPARASVASGAERDRLYEEFVSRFPGTAGHQARAGRQIPIVLLQRVG
jgi:deazaflavin-dependent oxidoreductase (nitroreductase family)